MVGAEASTASRVPGLPSLAVWGALLCVLCQGLVFLVRSHIHTRSEYLSSYPLEGWSPGQFSVRMTHSQLYPSTASSPPGGCYLYVDAYFVCMYVYAPHVCLVPREASRGSYGWL